MIDGVKYEGYAYSLSYFDVKDKSWHIVKTEHFTSEETLSKYRKAFSENVLDNVTYYHDFCREWNSGNKKYLECLIGFVSDSQEPDFWGRVIQRKDAL